MAHYQISTTTTTTATTTATVLPDPPTTHSLQGGYHTLHRVVPNNIVSMYHLSFVMHTHTNTNKSKRPRTASRTPQKNSRHISTWWGFLRKFRGSELGIPDPRRSQAFSAASNFSTAACASATRKFSRSSAAKMLEDLEGMAVRMGRPIILLNYKSMWVGLWVFVI